MGCPQNKQKGQYDLMGKTMGTYYKVSLNEKQTDLKADIDSILVDINQSVSTYIPNSTISKINQFTGESYTDFRNDRHFDIIFNQSKNIYTQTNGYFDPCVMPLVNYWGFGYTEKKPVESVDSLKINEMKSYSNFAQTKLERNSKGVVQLKKFKPETQLDFSAIAKGYAVDKIARYLHQKGIKDYLVDIGGELVAKGKNPKGNDWKVGINEPTETSAINSLQAVAFLNNQAIATSGNYRNYYEKDGQKYVHTINPKTGYPEISSLLSVSVFAKDCMTADAYATACMAMGLDQARQLIESKAELEAYFIYAEQDSLKTYQTKGAPIQ